jgi:hypothetical protein
LYPDTLLMLFMMSWIFLVKFFISFIFKIISFTNSNSLTSSFPVYVHVIFSSCSIALGRNSMTI